MFKLEEAKEKRKNEQTDNSSDVYYLGSLCFVKVSKMVKKMSTTWEACVLSRFQRW